MTNSAGAGGRGALARLKRSVARRGVLGTVRFACSELYSRSATGLRRAWNNAAGRRFDRRFGVETSGIIPASELDIPGDRQEAAKNYQPVSLSQVRRVLAGLQVDYEKTVFVDLGAGKGRAVLLASALPFKRVIGIELSERLLTLARENAARFAAQGASRAPIELRLEDASEFVPPDDPLVLYLYNPFEEPVMGRVAASVLASYRRAPRRIVVLYFNPICPESWDALPVLLCTHRDRHWHIYDTQTPQEES